MEHIAVASEELEVGIGKVLGYRSLVNFSNTALASPNRARSTYFLPPLTKSLKEYDRLLEPAPDVVDGSSAV